ncbi:MAG: hypothetical protein IPJ59_32590 [Nannocystis sp.]|nr:hypothetical protein [Nannocystis sp.]MBK7829895.1 hypothetical protein [Nannocystis sp.]
MPHQREPEADPAVALAVTRRAVERREDALALRRHPGPAVLDADPLRLHRRLPVPPRVLQQVAQQPAQRRRVARVPGWPRGHVLRASSLGLLRQQRREVDPLAHRRPRLEPTGQQQVADQRVELLDVAPRLRRQRALLRRRVGQQLDRHPRRPARP